MKNLDQLKYQKIHEFLKHHPMAILSTVSEDIKPWGAAIHYIADDKFNFFFVTRAGTAKYKNIEKNPNVALTVADNETQTTVQAAGKISKVPTDQYTDIVFKQLASIRPRGDFHWVPPLTKVHKGDFMVLRLTPTTLQYANYKQLKSDIHDDYIEKII